MAVARIWDADNGEWVQVGGPPHVVDGVEPVDPVDGLMWTDPASTISYGIGGSHSVSRSNVGTIPVATGTWTNCHFGSAAVGDLTWDSAGFYNPTTPYRFRVPPGLGGRYQIFFNIEFAYNNSGMRSMRILVNTVVYNLLCISGATTLVTVNWRGNCNLEIMLNENDIVDFQVWQATGASLNLLHNRASMTRVGNHL